MLTYALGVGLSGMLTIGAAADQVGTGSVAAGQVTQYCVPPHDYPDAHRFYCRERDDWPCPTGAAFSCFMQEIEEMMRSWSLRLNDGGAGSSPTGAGSPIWHSHRTFGNGAKDSVQERDFFLRILRPSPFVPVSWIGVDADRTNQTAELTT
jgi:hypothetical protein